MSREPPQRDEETADSGSLIGLAGASELLSLNPSAESVWIEVIHKMDSVYADLVHYQVELEQKNAELEEAHHFISSVLSSMTDVLIVCDTEGRIEQVNAALEQLTGRRAEQLLQQPLTDLFVDESRLLLHHFSQRMGQCSLMDCEISLCCADGSEAPLAMNCSSRYDADGALLGMVLLGRPVGELRRAYDELKRTQQQLVQSEKMASLGRLVAGVAHELNNPISVVFGNMHALKRYGARITEYLQAAAAEGSARLQQERQTLRIDRIMEDLAVLTEGSLEGAERISNIVQDLRRYSGAQRERASRFDLPALIQTSVEWVSKASRVPPALFLELPEQLEIEGYKGRVQQILVNLVQNGVDATPQPQLTIRCQAEQDQVRVEVIDNGPGIPAEEMLRLFDPFFTTKPVGQGVGLGLYICYGLAQEMGGALSAGNHPEGGARFSLILPCKPVERGDP